MAVSPDDLGGWEDLVVCCDPADFQPDVWASAKLIAVEVMWAALGRRYGHAEFAISPPCRPCSTRFAYYRAAWPFTTFPFPRGAGWWDLTPDRRGFAVNLPSPVIEVTEVKVDGAVLPPEAYMVRNSRTLVRCDGERWPRCPDDCDPDAFVVTGERGRAVPHTALAGAGELACQIAKACTPGQECRLPARVQTVARQGVTVTVANPKDYLDDGYIGLPLCDLAISQFNRSHGRAPSGVFRADELYPTRR